MRLKSIFIALILAIVLSCNKNEGNKAPLIAFVSPLSNTIVYQGDAVTFKVQVNDPDGLIRAVQYSIGEDQIFETTDPPYEFVWETSSFSSGMYSIKATVIDNEGALGTTTTSINLGPLQATLSALDISNVGPISATSKGTLTNQSTAEVIERGVCWNTIENPSVDDFKTMPTEGDLDDDVTFSVVLTNLELNTQYFARAYAIIGSVIIYGEQIDFSTTTEFFSDQGTFIDERDGIAYEWVKIGGQTWMAENLKYGDNLVYQGIMGFVYGYRGELGNDGFPMDYDFAYAKTLENFDTFGFIYQGISSISCPDGWRVPETLEWLQLINYLGGQENAGRHLKSTNADLWIEPNNASNYSNFSVLPGGSMSNVGSGYQFIGLGTSTSFWATDSRNIVGNTSQSIVSFTSDGNQVNINTSTRYYDTGYCRCIKAE